MQKAKFTLVYKQITVYYGKEQLGKNSAQGSNNEKKIEKYWSMRNVTRML